jgi:hypothetical protein
MEIPAGSSEPAAPLEVGFAPRDLTDGRPPGYWRSRYESAAWKWIVIEGAYLILLLLAVVVAITVVWLRLPATWWQLSSVQSATFTRYAYAWLGGTLGGVLFAMKWLYHSVGKEMWNIDRSPWRYLTPHISGGLAFATIAILNSIMAAESSPAMSGTKAIAMGFLVGFFSDNALAKLAEVAETLLGPSRKSAPPRLDAQGHGEGSTRR